MKRCMECNEIYQGTSCECGFTEQGHPQSTPLDEWVRFEAIELNGTLDTIKRWKSFKENLPAEKHGVVDDMIISLNKKIEEQKKRTGRHWERIKNYRFDFGQNGAAIPPVQTVQKTPKKLSQVIEGAKVTYLD